MTDPGSDEAGIFVYPKIDCRNRYLKEVMNNDQTAVYLLP